jgi:hypothetical protein
MSPKGDPGDLNKGKTEAYIGGKEYHICAKAAESSRKR